MPECPNNPTEHADGAWIGALRRLLARIEIWRDRAHRRRQLAEMRSSEWKDLGLSQWDVRCEVNKPFWRP